MILFSIIRYISKKISFITKQERRRLVLELYNEGKTKHEIAKEARYHLRYRRYFAQGS
jgi:hypothetical protein